MSDLAYATIRTSLHAQPLFEAKTWQLSPQAWPLTPDQLAQLEQIGAACLEFHQALETLYLRSAQGKNLLRNKPLLAPWVADYLDRGKPAELIAHARDARNRNAFPVVLRPDLLLTDDGFALTELDSVPGGIGLTAFLNRLYGGDTDGKILGQEDAMIANFHAALAALRPAARNPLIAILVSEEAGTYRPEMQWLAEQLQRQGRRGYCLAPDDVFPLGGELFFDIEGTPEKIDVIYRFFELFDWANIKVAAHILEAWSAGQVAIAPPMRHFQEEKLALALFHHHLLQEFWAENINRRNLERLRQLIPQSWVMDPAPLPPGAVLDGPRVGTRMLNDWRDLAGASQKERDLIIKISGFHETAWGARSVVLGSDCSREEWQAGVEQALALAPTNLHVLQEYRKPKRVSHPVYDPAKDGLPAEALAKAGRLRLCPYYFIIDGQARLSGALATFCPPDKKIIHGMQDAALLPSRVLSLS
ncbi:MAG TPA: hypothetical protein VFJ90_10935 [Candidatus Didemnitutus sp.]|nr:hypothetical protein [Candidatus Didemnitutus sp.]